LLEIDIVMCKNCVGDLQFKAIRPIANGVEGGASVLEGCSIDGLLLASSLDRGCTSASRRAQSADGMGTDFCIEIFVLANAK
jgi:hypothetical protein